LTQTSIQLSWLHSIEFAGFYAASQHGDYARAGLDVRVENGGFDVSGAYIDPVERVISGKSAFGVAGADVILKARAAGKPLVAIAAIYQRSPVVLISLPETNISSPQDLIGHHVLTEPETTVALTYAALLASQKIDRATIKETARTDFTVNPLFTGAADVLPGFITNEAVQVQLRGQQPNLILASDYGIDIYSNVIFTSEEIIKTQPALVEAFVRGTTRGMQYAIDHPKEVAQYVVDTYGVGMDPAMKASQELGMLASLPLLNPARSRPGMMTPTAWETAYQMMREQGLLNQPLDVSAAYTLTFLEAAYRP
jgi:NitT/TauT family transport system substrate-binding protein